MRRLTLLTAGLALLLGASGAQAQGLDAERFAPAAGAAGGLQIERPVVPRHLGYGLGLFLNLADDSVVVRDRVTGDGETRLLDHGLSADLLASLGLFDFAELALHVPLRLAWTGPATTVDGAALDADPGLGDIRIVPKVSFGWSGDATGGTVFGLAAPVSLPTGEAARLRGAGVVTVEPRFLATVYGPRWFLTGSAGFRVRGEDGPGSPGHEVTFGAAWTYTPPIEDDPLDLQIEAIGGWLPGYEGRRFAALPVELLGAIVWKPQPRWSVYGGGGVGVTNGIAVPDARGLVGVRYSVGVPGRGGERDDDTDGIADKADRCPTEAEDMDGFEDDDGCPEPDNDRDGIGDDDDECPDVPEERGGDKDGCPDKPTVIVRRGQLIVYGKILFPVESADMKPQSEALLDEMARALKEHPRFRIEIAGHTDSSGLASYNLKLSQDRADSVKRALVRRGVASGRLVAKGYGEDRPVAPNLTRAGRAKNRRVDFNIRD